MLLVSAFSNNTKYAGIMTRSIHLWTINLRLGLDSLRPQIDFDEKIFFLRMHGCWHYIFLLRKLISSRTYSRKIFFDEFFSVEELNLKFVLRRHIHHITTCSYACLVLSEGWDQYQPGNVFCSFSLTEEPIEVHRSIHIFDPRFNCFNCSTWILYPTWPWHLKERYLPNDSSHDFARFEKPKLRP